MPSRKPQRVLNPNVKRSHKTINGHKVQSFRPNKSTTATSSKPSEPKVHIGAIGHVDHSKTTLTAAIERTLILRELFKEIFNEEYDHNNYDHRVMLQSAVYVLENMGLNIGDYSFSWNDGRPFSNEPKK